jgi:RNA-binding protein YhbY
MRQLTETKKFQIGKKGLTEEFIKQIETTFTTCRKIKIDILKSACRDKEEAKQIAQTLIDRLGKNFDYKLIGYVLTIMKFNKAVRK